jgi:hypothetical protein
MKTKILTISTWKCWLAVGAVDKWHIFRLIPTVALYTYNGWKSEVCIDLTWLFWGMGVRIKRAGY